MAGIADAYRASLQEQQPTGIADAFRQSQGQPQAPSGFNATYQDTGDTLYDEDLINDVNYQKASEVIYNMNNSVDAPRLTPEEYAKYGIETMGWFNWNLPKMSLDAARISGASEEQKAAFLYMMEAYDDLGVSWNGAGRFFKGVLTDPTTYVGLTTFGVGLAGKAGAGAASKQGIKELLKSSTRGGIIAGVESGVYTAVDDINRQVVETAVSGEDIDVGRVVKSGAIGVGAGFTLGTGITAVAKKVVPRETLGKVIQQSIVEEAAPLDVGVYVKAGDRGNIGKVVSMEGDTVTVNFQNKEKGTEATITFKQDEVKSVTKVKKAKIEDKLIDDLPEDTGEVVFHRTTAEPFFEFIESPNSPHSHAGSKGFYFSRTADDETTVVFGDNVVEARVDIKNPVPIQTVAMDTAPEGFTFGRVDLDYLPDDLSSVRFIDDAGKLQDVDNLSKAEINSLLKKNKLFYQVNPERLFEEDIAVIRKAGYDGFKMEAQGDKPGQVVALSSDQIKVQSFTEGGNIHVAPSSGTRSPAQKIRSDLDTVIQAIKRTVPAGKVASVSDSGVQNMEELVASVEPISILLADSAAKTPQELATFLKKQELTDGQSEFLEVATSQSVSALKVKVFNLRLKQQQLEGEEALAISKQIDEIETVIAPLDELDAALSTITGQRLRARQESLNTGDVRGVTIKSLEEQGLSRTEAERQFDALFAEKMLKHERTQEIAALSAKIEEVRKSGDLSKYIELKGEKKLKLDEFKEEVLLEEGSAVYRAINKPIKVLNEVMISFVFSPATLIVNTVPSLAKAVYKPFLNNLMQDGLSATSRKKIVAEYSAMFSMFPTAAKMAKAAWRYEKSILTGDSARFLEEYNTIPKKFGGGVLRHFPRALLATDAFFENIHYRGYAVGKATGDAMEAGVAKGLKGKELDDFVKAEVETAVSKAYAPEENAIDILMSDGISRGLKGKKLENFINKELAKNESAFVKATDQNGRDYVQDILFKRDFSGNGAASQLAKGYEGFVNKHPAMRLMGQLFFRTPVRVFEEGIRLTPGLNLISPGFMKDLKGVNGPMRQARAQGEALMSYSIAGSVFALYSTGNVTGAMGTDYKQTRQGENTGGQEPYTIKFDDGSAFNYRNFDPFSTPIKIIVNALERAETLAYRAEQGEAVNKTEMEKIQAIVAVGVGSIAQSIRDANLASGVDAAADFFEDLGDPESSDQLIKFVGRKVQTFLPNTYYKYQMLDNPVLGDPVTMEQFIRQRVNPDDPLVPKQYTALGRARTLSNPAASLYYFDKATVEERKRGVPEKELEVERFLFKLSQVGDTHFTAPYKYDKYMGDIDLRTQLTKDGTETYYDRWMRYTHESGLIDVLHGLQDLPMGTASQAGIAEQYARKYINQFREVAFMRLFSEEAAIPQQYQNVLQKAATITSGQRSSDNIMYNIGN